MEKWGAALRGDGRTSETTSYDCIEPSPKLLVAARDFSPHPEDRNSVSET
jgi:hypothetical protein